MTRCGARLVVLLLLLIFWSDDSKALFLLTVAPVIYGRHRNIEMDVFVLQEQLNIVLLLSQELHEKHCLLLTWGRYGSGQSWRWRQSSR